MKYTDALKIYNKGKTKWCFPRKGSADYIKVKKIQGKPVVKVKNAVKKVSKKKKDVIKVEVIKNISKKPKSISNKVFIKDVAKAESKTPEFVEVSRN